ncbi:RABGAP1L, partial [Symbiodinium sp. CCMP2456]
WRVWKAAAQLDAEPAADYGSLCDQENKWTASIEIDVPRTFPELKAFDEEQQQRLRRVLNAYASYNPDCGYCQGMNYVAGLLLLVSRCEEESFWVFVRLMDHEDFGLGGFYVGRLPLLRRYLRACENLVAESLPELREHFIKQNVQPAVYLHQWFLTLFINCFPISMVMILWDVIMCEGLTVILRIAVSILQVLKDSLLSMEFEEIIKFFKMMKTYHDEDGELGAVKIGQLLMKHTEQVHIPKETIQYLRAGLDDDPHLDSDESWENEQSSWSSYLSRMFSWRKSSTPNTL